MQSFDIIKKSELENTYRVKAIKDTYDLQIDQTNERFVGTLGRKNIGTSVSVFFILKIILRFFDKLFFFAFFVVWNF